MYKGFFGMWSHGLWHCLLCGDNKWCGESWQDIIVYKGFFGMWCHGIWHCLLCGDNKWCGEYTVLHSEFPENRGSTFLQYVGNHLQQTTGCHNPGHHNPILHSCEENKHIYTHTQYLSGVRIVMIAGCQSSLMFTFHWYLPHLKQHRHPCL